MSDPRAEDRIRHQQRSDVPSQLMERIKQRLSPCDDALPFAQAVRQRDEMQQAVEAFRRRGESRA